MSRVVEHTEHEARPLVKVYSCRKARALFDMFDDVKVEVKQLLRQELRFLSPFVSEKMFDRLQNQIGWNVVITATK
jgi:hypothetical protein